MPFYLAALLLGVLGGLRTLTPLAATSWAARLGGVHVEGTWLAFLGLAGTPYILTVLAIAELINDKLPRTPSRKLPAPFVARVVTGAVCGAAFGFGSQAWVIGLLLGGLGGVAGTLGGYEFRKWLASALGGKDFPAALLEDAVAVIGAVCVVLASRPA